MGLSLFFSIHTSFFSLLSLIRGREVRREREGEKQRDRWIHHKDHHLQKTLASTMGLSLFFSIYTSFFSLLSLIRGREVRREREGEKQRDKWIQHKDNLRQKTLASTMGLSLRIQHKDHHLQKTLASSMGLSLFFSIYTSFFSLLSLIWGREVRREREGEKQRDKWIQHKDNLRQKTLASTMGLSLRIQHKDHHLQKTLASTMGLSLFFSIYTSFFSLLSLIRGREVRREREGEKQRDKWIQHKDNLRQKTLASTMGLSLRIQHKDHHRQKTLASSMGLSLFFSIYTSFFSLLSLIWGREVRREREGEKQRDKWIQQHKDSHHQKTLASTMGMSLFCQSLSSPFSL